MPQAAKQRPPQRYHNHDDIKDITSLYQMLGISGLFGCRGLCPVALLETQSDELPKENALKFKGNTKYTVTTTVTTNTALCSAVTVFSDF